MGRVDGKVVLISGGARGMGAEEVGLFAREGARVVFGDILDDLGQQVEADQRAQGHDVAYAHLDVTSEADWQAIVALAEERYGKLDALVNNAGISISVEGGARNISLEETTEEQWDRVMDVNSKGVPGHQSRDTCHAAGRRWLHRQHFVHRRPIRRLVALASLQRIQRRGTPVHQGHRHPVRCRGHPRQLGAPWPHNDAHERIHLR